MRSKSHPRVRPTRIVARAGALAVPFLAAVTGCARDYPTSADPGLLVVNGLLVVGAPEQTILLERTRSMDEGFLRAPTGVADADVTVTAADGSVHVFEAVPDSVGWYRAAFRAGPGTEYRLRVVAPDGRTVTARTRTPGSPVLVKPANDTAIAITGGSVGVAFPMAWHPAASAAYVITYSTLAGPSPEWLLAILIYFDRALLSDTTGAAMLGLTQYPNGAALSVAAVDSAYARYVGFEPRETAPLSAARSTIDGGLGVFGSVAFSEARKVVVEWPESQ